MKDRLISCASQSLDKIAQNPLAEEAISSNRLNQNVQILSITLTEMHKEPCFNVKPTKILSVFGGRGLAA